MGGTKGNWLSKTGYGCEMVNLVASWRAAWSKTPGTTDPLAPFGIVTLASSGSEGGPNMGKPSLLEVPINRLQRRNEMGTDWELWCPAQSGHPQQHCRPGLRLG